MKRRTIEISAKKAVIGISISLFASAAFLVIALVLIGKTSGIDWQELSNIGDALGAVSALASVAALIAVVASLNAQRNQVASNEVHAIRTTRIDLLKIGLEEPEFLSSWGFVASDTRFSGVDPRRAAYASAVLGYINMSFQFGVVTEDELRSDMPNIFGDTYMVQLWRVVRTQPHYIDKHAAFHRIVDEVFRSCVDQLDGSAVRMSAPEQTPDSRSGDQRSE